jgi:HEAT repeat protein
LGFDAFSDPVLEFALSASVGALAATLAFGLAVVFTRQRLLGRMRTERDVTARWNPLIAECAERVPAVLPPIAQGELEGFLILWCRALESLRGDAHEHLREMARRLGIEARLRELLRSDKMQRQLLAVVCLGHMRSREVIPTLLELVREAPSVVSLNAARALMRVDPAIAMPHVLEATAQRQDWALAHVVPSFAEVDPEQVAPVLAAAIGTELYKESRGLRVGGVARLLHLHVTAHGAALREALLGVLAEAEAPSALVAALSALSHPQDIEHARRLLQHPHWPVRAAAARTLGRLGTEEDFARLRDALADANWWVRYRAAQALCALPRVAATELHDLAKTLHEPLAADALRQALAERQAR